MDDLIEMHAKFQGEVQGVGFRATVRFHAAKLHLSGIVRNLSDGSVECFVQGTRKDLDQLIERIKQQPGAARIDSVSVVYGNINRPYPHFAIVHGE